MWKLKLLLGAVILIAISAVGMVINADNTNVVSPTLFGISLPSASLGVWLFATLLAGGILGFIVSLLSTLKSHGQKALLSRKLKQCENELAQLRTSALRD